MKNLKFKNFFAKFLFYKINKIEFKLFIKISTKKIYLEL